MKTLKAVLLATLISGHLILVSCDTNDEKVDVTKIGLNAFIISQNFVQGALKAPATANFPLGDYTAFYQGDSTYIVKSYVDAENEFGAKIRTKYKVQLKYKGGDLANPESWLLQHISTY